MHRTTLIVALVLVALSTTTLANAAVAPGTTAAGSPAKEIAKLKRKIAALNADVARLRTTSPAAIAAQLETAKRITDRYETVDAAVAAGYVQGSPCESSPQGGMGFHYINPAAIQDPKLHPFKPEILLYAQATGGMQLIGVEFMKVDGDQSLATDGDRPTLFGRAFDGPMLGHAPGMPTHYDLHVWLQKRNPNGIFAQWNPDVACK
jgi:hypothetical protein